MQQGTQHWAHTRKHELDWLRVLAFGLLIIYHVGMAYVADWGWHVKSNHQSEFLQNLMLWSNQWRMSLLFIISGAAVSFQLAREPSWRLATGITGRVLPAVFFGMFIIVAPQVYIELKSKELLTDTNYFSFWQDYAGSAVGLGEPLPHAYIRGAYTNLTWNHLWYLPYLLAYSLAVWAIYPLICNSYTAKIALVVNALPQASIWLGLYILPIATLFIIGETLWQAYPTTFALVNDWYNNARYFFVFVFGVLAVRSTTLWQAIHQLRTLSVVAATLTYALILFFIHGGELSTYIPWLNNYENTIRSILWPANTWLWLMTVLGYGQHFFNKPNKFISKANKGVFCFYIVHQTIIVVAVYWFNSYSLSPWLEPLFVIAITVLGCLGCYLAAQRFLREKGWAKQLIGIHE